MLIEEIEWQLFINLRVSSTAPRHPCRCCPVNAKAASSISPAYRGYRPKRLRHVEVRDPLLHRMLVIRAGKLPTCILVVCAPHGRTRRKSRLAIGYSACCYVLVSVNRPGRPLPYSADRFSSQATRLAFSVSTVCGLAESACASESQTCPRVCGMARPARKRSGRTTAIDAG